MGAILKVINEITGAHIIDCDIHIDIELQNWRVIREDTYKSVKGLYVLHKNYREYFLPSFSLASFHKANHNNTTLDIQYSYVQNRLSCAVCYGNGKLDWVQAARGEGVVKKNPVYVSGMEDFDFIRAKDGPIHFIKSCNHGIECYTSAAVLNDGDEICKACYGSGAYLQLYTKNEMPVRMIIKNS